MPRPIDLDSLAVVVRGELGEDTPIYVFGSCARGDTHEASDLDLAVLPAQPLAPMHGWALQERLASLAGRDVDLVDLRSASAVLRVRVLDEGRLVHEGDRHTREAFEMFALADYARLNEERAAILADIRTRGRIHG